MLYSRHCGSHTEHASCSVFVWAGNMLDRCLPRRPGKTDPQHPRRSKTRGHNPNKLPGSKSTTKTQITAWQNNARVLDDSLHYGNRTRRRPTDLLTEHLTPESQQNRLIIAGQTTGSSYIRVGHISSARIVLQSTANSLTLRNGLWTTSYCLVLMVSGFNIESLTLFQ